jgi:hypothetical protein
MALRNIKEAILAANPDTSGVNRVERLVLLM